MFAFNLNKDNFSPKIKNNYSYRGQAFSEGKTMFYRIRRWRRQFIIRNRLWYSRRCRIMERCISYESKIKCGRFSTKKSKNFNKKIKFIFMECTYYCHLLWNACYTTCYPLSKSKYSPKCRIQRNIWGHFSHLLNNFRRSIIIHKM